MRGAQLQWTWSLQDIAATSNAVAGSITTTNPIATTWVLKIMCSDTMRRMYDWVSYRPQILQNARWAGINQE